MIVTVHTLSGGTITDHFKGGREMLPKDPHMLASFLNLKLRDFYPSLDALCDDLGVDKQEIVQKLEAEEYSYDPERNQFI